MGVTHETCIHGVDLVSVVGGPGNYCEQCEKMGYAFVLPATPPKNSLLTVELPEVDLSALQIERHVLPCCWASACQKPSTHVLLRLNHYSDLSFINEVGYCWECMEFFAENWLRYPKHTFPLGYYALEKVIDTEGDAW